MKQSMVAAFKRKNVKDILEEVLRSEGNHEAADEVKGQGRLTVALIDRTCIAEDTPATEEETSEKTDPEKLTYADDEKEILRVGDIKALVATGKKKKIAKAKEAFKAQFKKGHPNYKELKKLLKNA